VFDTDDEFDNDRVKLPSPWPFFERSVESPTKFKCTLCPHLASALSKSNDAGLRLHLGRVHGMQHMLYPSQKTFGNGEHRDAQKTKLDDAAIKAIIRDARPFGDFRKPGMQYFLATAVAGYRGPHGKTVARRVNALHKKYVPLVRKALSQFRFVSLTADVWKNSRLIIKWHF
jgi:hypothetical protein